MFIEPEPGMFSIPFIFSIAPGEGLAPGIGIFIPGMFICVCEDAAGWAPGEGEARGICIPGMFISIFCGDADGDGLVCGMFIPGIFI